MQFRNGSYAVFAVQGNKIRNMKTNRLKRKQENEEKAETYGTEKNTRMPMVKYESYWLL